MQLLNQTIPIDRKFVLLAGLVAAFGVRAENDLEFIIVGPALTPEFQGSEDYAAVPMVVSQFNAFGSRFEIEGLDFRGELYTESGWRAGVAASFAPGRDDEVENLYVRRMAEVDSAFLMGSFVAKDASNLIVDGDDFEFRTAILADVSGTHDGYYGTVTAAYALPLMLPFRVEFELETTYASRDYMDTYFGVNTLDAERSGFDFYEASSSLRDASLTANIGFFTSPTWGAFMRAGVSKMLGEASDSPIVESGSDIQYFVGLGVFYRFGGKS